MLFIVNSSLLEYTRQTCCFHLHERSLEVNENNRMPKLFILMHAVYLKECLFSKRGKYATVFILLLVLAKTKGN